MFLQTKVINGQKVLVPLTGDTEHDTSYSTTEIDIGKTWIDGKPIYRKVINFGALPNNTTKQVAHGISNLGWIVNISGVSYDTNSYILLPYIGISSVSKSVNLYANATNVIVITGEDKTNYTTTYVIVEYTKSS